MNSFQRLFGITIIGLLSLSSLAPLSADPEVISSQERALRAMIDEMRTHYAWMELKEEFFGLSFDALEEEFLRLVREAKLPHELYVRAQVEREHLSRAEFQQLLIALAGCLRDGHGNILRSSGDYWTLGFFAASIGPRLYVTGLDSKLFVSTNSGQRVEVGDEVISIDGVSVQELASANLPYVQTGSFADIVSSSLEATVNVSERWWLPVDSSKSVRVRFRKKDGTEYEGVYDWTNRKIVQNAHTDFRFLEPNFQKPPVRSSYVYGTRGTMSYFLSGLGAITRPERLMDVGAAVNAQLEKSHQVTRLKALIVTRNNKRIGVLRIPSYTDTERELAWLERVIPILEAQTDVLIIDHLDNGGGSNLYAANFLSFFAGDEAMETLQKHILLSETLLKELESQDWLGSYSETLGELAKARERVARWRELYEAGTRRVIAGGHDNMSGTRENGPGLVLRAPERGRYSKPILLLNSMRSASNGDEVPAILKFNERVVLMGESSAGLGGSVYRSSGSVTSAEMMVRLTFAGNTGPEGQHMENVGAIPDISRVILPGDLRGGFRDYARQALDVATALSVRGKTRESVIEDFKAQWLDPSFAALAARATEMFPTDPLLRAQFGAAGLLDRLDMIQRLRALGAGPKASEGATDCQAGLAALIQDVRQHSPVDSQMVPSDRFLVIQGG